MKIRHHTIIVRKEDVIQWAYDGWRETPDFRDLGYSPKENETIVSKAPLSLARIDATLLVGKSISNFSYSLGSYGMGSPGFLGLWINNFLDLPYATALVYTAWGASDYTLLNGRCLSCVGKYELEYRPWVRKSAYETDLENLTKILSSAVIDAVEILNDSCVFQLKSNSLNYELHFHKNDNRVAPTIHDEPRSDAFNDGVIADHIVFQHEKAVLWV